MYVLLHVHLLEFLHRKILDMLKISYNVMNWYVRMCKMYACIPGCIGAYLRA